MKKICYCTAFQLLHKKEADQFLKNYVYDLGTTGSFSEISFLKNGNFGTILMFPHSEESWIKFMGSREREYQDLKISEAIESKIIKILDYPEVTP